MTVSQICMIVTIAIYLLFMLAVGAFYSKKNKNVGDFYLGGRKLGPLVTAMSAEASDMSSWLLMGLPGLALAGGICEPIWTAIGLAVGTYFNWLIVAKRIRRYSVATNSITIPEFFSNRYRDNKNVLALIAAVVIIIFFIPYTASGFSACGKLFSNLFSIDYLTAMIISAIIIVGYTTLGGFLAASTTDLIQSVIMTIALFVVLGFGEGMSGGLNQVIANAKELTGYLSLKMSYSVAQGTTSPYSIITIISTLAWGLGYFGMPHILLRFMAIEDEKKLKLSRRVASVWVVISLAAAILIGVVGYSMFKGGLFSDSFTMADSESIIIVISELLGRYGYIPAIIAGIILAGILAATMSTADSQLLASSSSVSQNIFKDFLHIKLSDRKAMVIARLTVIATSIIAIFIARNPDSSVFRIVSFAWAGFGAAFGPVVLFALFWKRSNKWGALAGMIAGGVMVFLWKYVIRPLGGIWDIYELLPAFILACIAIVAVSLLTPPPSKEIVDEFESVKTSR